MPCLTGKCKTKRTELGQKTPKKTAGERERERVSVSKHDEYACTSLTQQPFETQCFLNYPTQPGRWEVAKLPPCLCSQKSTLSTSIFRDYAKGTLITPRGSKETTLTDVQITSKQPRREVQQMTKAGRGEACQQLYWTGMTAWVTACQCQPAGWAHIFIFLRWNTTGIRMALLAEGGSHSAPQRATWAEFSRHIQGRTLHSPTPPEVLAIKRPLRQWHWFSSFL